MKNTKITKHAIIKYRLRFSISAIIGPATGIFLINLRSFCIAKFVTKIAMNKYIATFNNPISLINSFLYYYNLTFYCLLLLFIVL